ncbi:hypothetical protein NMG60_11001508 [Bertholletia excelsa]
MSDSTTIDMAYAETSVEAKGKAPLLKAPVMVETAERGKGGMKRGVAIFDLIVRISALVTALAAAAAMGTADESLPFFTQFFQFEAGYDDLPAFQTFVIAMAIACGYLALSIPFSIVCIARPHAVGPRMFLIIFDIVMVAATGATASSAAAIVYLAHNGNTSANWLAVCQQFTGFCQRTSGAVVAAFITVVLLVLLVLLSAVALRTH